MNYTIRHLVERLEGIESKPALVTQNYGRDTVITVANLYNRKPSVGYHGVLKNPDLGCSCAVVTRSVPCVKYHCCFFNSKTGARTRGKVQKFSYRSRRRCRLVLRNIIDKMKVEIGLTYPKDFPADGRIVKRHFKAIREWLRRRHVGIFWIEEFQERGAPHIHALLTMPVDSDALAKAWYKIVGSGDPKHLKHGTHYEWLRSPEKTASYYTEYMNKLQQKLVPVEFENIGRFWGYSKGLLKVIVNSIHGDYKFLYRLLRQDRRRYKAKCRSWGFKWKWQGKGWTFWDYATSPPGAIGDSGPCPN